MITRLYQMIPEMCVGITKTSKLGTSWMFMRNYNLYKYQYTSFQNEKKIPLYYDERINFPLQKT